MQIPYVVPRFVMFTNFFNKTALTWHEPVFTTRMTTTNRGQDNPYVSFPVKADDTKMVHDKLNQDVFVPYNTGFH